MLADSSALLSCYRVLGALNPEKNVQIIQDRGTNKLYLLKEYEQYDADVYAWLQSHPVANMPQIIALSREGERLLVVEEYLAGETVQELLDTQGPFSEEAAADCILQLCTILSALHAAQPPIIHRDIKPSNLILSPDGVLKLIDVNAAKRCKEHTDRDTALLGTPGYAAPEQYGISSSSVQTDLFAVGSLMNVMLCGELPTTQTAGGRLGPIIRKCLELNPRNRYASAEELGRAIRTAMRTAQPQGWRRLLPPGLRSGNPFLTAAALLGYLLLLCIGMTLEVQPAEHPANVLADRLLMSAMLICLVLFTGNYLNVQRFLPFSRRKGLRLVSILLGDVLIVLFFALCASILQTYVF